MCASVPTGAIVNLWFPNWLLALMWVLAMLGSNLELLVSFIRYLRVKQEAADIAARLRMMSPPPSSGAGTAGGTVSDSAHAGGTANGTLAGAGSLELTPGASVGDSRSPLTGGVGLRQRDSSAGGAMSRGEVMRERADLMARAQRLAKQAHKIEARALLYPTLYVPDVGKALQVRVVVGLCALQLLASGWRVQQAVPWQQSPCQPSKRVAHTDTALVRQCMFTSTRLLCHCICRKPT